jgi:multicomponent Na+:H+ antiporter subunit A
VSIFVIHLSLLALTGLVLWLLRPHRFAFAGWLAAIPPAIVTVWQAMQLTTVAEGNYLTEQIAWSPALGLALSFRLDGLSLFFGLIITGIGAAIALYTAYYFEHEERLGYFYCMLFLFMASMLGLVWSDNLLAIFLFWEGTSITSYLLISYKITDEKALKGARTAIIVTGGGALAMLAGFVLLGQSSGSYRISEILTGPLLYDHPYYIAMTLLILVGAFTKSALFHFHFWLPGAMAAPKPASAYLHSATMVKAGIYLLARLHPVLSDSELWFWSLFLVGGVTMLLGAISAFRYYDLKALLANATISQLGILVMLLAFQSKEAYIAVVVGILAHALYKGPLFMIAGIIDHATGTRDLRRLANLRQAMPLVTITAVLAGLSMAGLPPFFGFLSKETLLETLHHFSLEDAAPFAQVGLWVGALGGALFVGYSLTLLWEAFFRPAAPDPQPAHLHHAPSVWFVLPALLLTLLGTAIPFLIGSVEKVLLGAPASTIANAPVEIHLALWHGFTPVFLISLAAIAVGVGLFWQRDQLHRLLTYVPAGLNGATIFDMLYEQTYALARWTTRVIQGGQLASQVSVTFLCLAAVVLYALVGMGGLSMIAIDQTSPLEIQELILTGLAIVAAIVTVRARNRLSAIISIGVVGVVVTLVFAFFGAPDLALTQLLIEVLTVVLLVLVFYRIPPGVLGNVSRLAQFRNVIMAVLVGGVGFVLTLISAAPSYSPKISPFFSLNSAAAAHGGNIVNVILVDFRGFDTMGEITVLALAAIGGYALLRSSRLRPAAHVTAKRPAATQAEAKEKTHA